MGKINVYKCYIWKKIDTSLRKKSSKFNCYNTHTHKHTHTHTCYRSKKTCRRKYENVCYVSEKFFNVINYQRDEKHVYNEKSS